MSIDAIFTKCFTQSGNTVELCKVYQYKKIFSFNKKKYKKISFKQLPT